MLAQMEFVEQLQVKAQNLVDQYPIAVAVVVAVVAVLAYAHLPPKAKETVDGILMIKKKPTPKKEVTKPKEEVTIPTVVIQDRPEVKHYPVDFKPVTAPAAMTNKEKAESLLRYFESRKKAMIENERPDFEVDKVTLAIITLRDNVCPIVND